MAKLPFMKWYPVDFYGDGKVMKLSTEARWAYRELLDMMWMNDGYVSADNRVIARMLRIDVRLWRKLLLEIGPLLTLQDDPILSSVYTQKRMTKEINAAEELVEKNRERTAKARRVLATKSGKRSPVTGPASRVSDRPASKSVTAPVTETVEPPVTTTATDPYTQNSDKEAADAAANHKASKEAAVSLASGALHPREEPRPDVEQGNQRRGDRADQGQMPEPERAVASTKSGASSLYARLAAERQRRATEDGKKED